MVARLLLIRPSRNENISNYFNHACCGRGQLPPLNQTANAVSAKDLKAGQAADYAVVEKSISTACSSAAPSR
ncbi:MAG: hypothetical protein ABIP71_00775 [Verrucomicrobiota bacterium]